MKKTYNSNKIQIQITSLSPNLTLNRDNLPQPKPYSK